MNVSFLKKCIVFSAILAVLLVAVSNVFFFYVNKRTTMECWGNLFGAAQQTNAKTIMISTSLLGATANIAEIFATDPSQFREPSIVEYVGSVRVGPFKSPVRLYAPDGYTISIKGGEIRSDVAQKYSKIVSPRPYFSEEHEDFLESGKMVVEYFFPVRFRGEVAAMLSVVIDAYNMLGFLKARGPYDDNLDVMLIDLRNNQFLQNSKAVSEELINGVLNGSDLNGISKNDLINKVKRGEKVNFSFKSQREKSTRYVVSMPCSIDNWTLFMVVDENVAFAKATELRRIFIVILVVELLFVFIYLLWLVRSVKRQLEQEKREFSEIANALSFSYDRVYYIDVENDSYQVLRPVGENKKLQNEYEGKNFFSDVQKKINSSVFADDVKKISRFMMKDRFLAKLESGNFVSLEYRIVVSERPVYFRLKALRLDGEGGHVVVAVENVDTEMRESMQQRRDMERRDGVIESLSKDFDCINYIDLLGDGRDDIVEQFRLSKTLAKFIPGWAKEKSFGNKMNLLLEYIVSEEFKTQFAQQVQLNEVLANLVHEPIYFVNFTAIIESKEHHYQMKFIADKDKQGKIKGVIFGIHCIDEEIRIQMDVQEKLERNLEIIDILSEDYTGLFFLNLETRTSEVLSISDRIRKDSGPIVERTVNIIDALREFVDTLVHPDDRYLFDQFESFESFKRLLKGKVRESIVFRRNYGGTYLYTKMTVAKSEKENEEPVVVAVGFAEIDFQYRMELERKENIDRVMTLSDEFELIYDVNIDSGLYVVSSKQDVSGSKLVGSVFHELDFFKSCRLNNLRTSYEEDREMLAECMSREYLLNRLEKEPLFAVDFRCLIDGEPRWYRMKIARVGDWTKGHRMFVGIFDNDENYRREKQQQQALEEALQLAKSASSAKTMFLNNMSHDIRTPMNAIIGYTELAAAHLDSKERLNDYLSKIFKSSNHLLSLINDVLDMSRIESGKMTLCEKTENLSDIIHTLKDIVQADAHAKQLEFSVNVNDVNDEYVICDKLRLNQVLLNLLSNSIKYTPANGAVSLSISQKMSAAEGYALFEFCVRDNGIGMDEKFLKTIYDPFTRVKSSTVSGIQGTGLGMAITKSIVEMMHGNIDVVSKENVGTEITVKIELKLSQGLDSRALEEKMAGKRILIVDDDNATCYSLAKEIRDLGLYADSCVSGRAAVTLVEKSLEKGACYDVIFVDWLMPDMNGLETIREMRKVLALSTPVIVMTAYDWSDIEADAEAVGVTGFICKPIFESDLKNVLLKYYCGEVKSEDNDNLDVDFSGKKILLVEDNELNREIAVEILTDAGICVDTAEDGTYAVDIMSNAKPGDYNLILMDVQMPIMDGYEATRRIRSLADKNVANIPIVAMTANAFADDCQAALDAGMNEHIAKPVDLARLGMVLKKFLL